MKFQKIEPDPRKREEDILRFWDEKQVFERSLLQTHGGPRYVFYEGPPTANGRPHFGHLLPRLYKDLFPRYKTMRGYFVRRKAGWDCHGLPVEIEVERELGINSKQAIEQFGVEAFIERCKASVQFYIGEWERMIRRMGFWIDLSDPYITYTDDYIETLWWEIKEIHDRGLLYQGHKILPYCPRCGTPLSSHEVAQGYRRTADPSVFVRMPLSNDPDVSILVWTTTPWTLPANVALAVNPDAEYVEVRINGERLILARARVEAVLGEGAEILRAFPGHELLGAKYEPLYPLARDQNAYQVWDADFVSMEEGTGIVHIAPAFGEEDYELAQGLGLPFLQPVDQAGRFTGDFPLAEGLFVKEADEKIIANLRARGRLFRAETYEHEYPFCWRCDTPLLYYAIDSWFIATTKVQDKLIAENGKVNWYPDHMGRGRFGDFLNSLRDWALSRDRYWGTPLPVWICERCGAIKVIGSRAELVEAALDQELARSVELHRPYVDRVKLHCQCGGVMQRVPYVLDTWFDSGSMHTAQWHYPFENEDLFRDSFPADFICEALDQTRGWFYTLHATSVLLHEVGCFRNVLVTGMGLDERGQKMSKSRGNVIDPLPLADEHGADAIRWYLAADSAPWTERRLSLSGVAKARFGFLDTVRNSHDFFTLYANIDKFDPESPPPKERPLLDRWLSFRVAKASAEVTEALDGYRVVEACRALEQFVDDFSNWYIRLSRPRFWGGGMTGDKLSAYHTLYEALRTLSALLAPFTPFLAEAMWQSLRREDDPESVHLLLWPSVGDWDKELLAQMERVRAVVSLALGARNLARIKVRQPLSTVYAVRHPGDELIPNELWDLAKAELNVHQFVLVDDLDQFKVPKLSPDFQRLGPRLGPLMPKVAQALTAADQTALWQTIVCGAQAELEVEGKKVVLSRDEIKVEWLPAEGFVVVEEPWGGVALDVRLNDELRAEGELRELVHQLQLARKKAGFEVTDRIEISYQGDIACVFRQFPKRIQDEVLAVSLREGDLVEAEYEVELEVHGRRGRVALKRVGRDTMAG